MTKVSLSVYSIILPLSVGCTILGLSTADFGKLQHVYCVIVAVLLFTFRTAFVFIKLYSVKLNFTNVILVLSEIGAILVLAYYRIKFILDGNNVQCILRTLHNVDRALESVGNKIPHIKDHVICYLAVLLIAMCRVILTHQFSSNQIFSLTQQNNISSVHPIFYISVNTEMFSSIAMLEFYVYLTLYILRRRLMTFHDSIVTLNSLSCTAWSSSCLLYTSRCV